MYGKSDSLEHLEKERGFPQRRVGCVVTLMIFGLALGACSSLRTDFVKRPSKALPPTTSTSSAQYIRSEVDKHLDKSGFRLLTQSTNALMSRIALADHAKNSIDLQYYIFNNDATGRLVAQRLLAAADRGARVRILLDDISVNGTIDMLDALDAHPGIEVRLFNPFHTRDPSFLSKAMQFVFDAHRLNRRMHNKVVYRRQHRGHHRRPQYRRRLFRCRQRY